MPGKCPSMILNKKVSQCCHLLSCSESRVTFCNIAVLRRLGFGIGNYACCSLLPCVSALYPVNFFLYMGVPDSGAVLHKKSD